MEKRIDLRRYRHLPCSLLLCLILLLCICSATDSFQQPDYTIKNEQRESASSLQTATAARGINLSPAVAIYGGAAASIDTASPTTGVTELGKRRRWIFFDPWDNRTTTKRRHRRRRRRQRGQPALSDDEYKKRKQEWADRYTTLDGLRATFGTNKNKLFGDLDAATTRKLYKSLLPTAVCELVLDVEVRPEELAELAFEARKAAKLYARERCHVPVRMLADWYDGFRALRRYGRFQTEGISYEQLFDKYYQRSAQERSSSISQKGMRETKLNRIWNKKNRGGDDNIAEWNEEDIVKQTCMKILESACRTNPLIDRMALHDRQKKNRRISDTKSNPASDIENLEKIAQRLEDDVRKLLDPYNR